MPYGLCLHQSAFDSGSIRVMASSNGNPSDRSNGHTSDNQASGRRSVSPSEESASASAQSPDLSCSCTYRSGAKKGKVCGKRAGSRPARSINNVPHLSFDENFRYNVSYISFVLHPVIDLFSLCLCLQIIVFKFLAFFMHSLQRLFWSLLW